MRERIFKQFVAETRAAGERRIGFTISSGNVDRDGDTVNAQGWDLTNYRKNPVVLWSHDYSALPIGKSVDIGVLNGRLRSVVEFADHPFAQTVFDLVKGGFLSATSVGFRPTKAAPNRERGGVDFQQQELLEYSIVPVPANADALVEARAAGIDVAPILKWAERVTKSLGAPASSGRDDVVLVLREDPSSDEVVLTLLDPLPDLAARGRRHGAGERFAVDLHDLRAITAQVLPAMLNEARSHLRSAIAREISAAMIRARGRVD